MIRVRCDRGHVEDLPDGAQMILGFGAVPLQLNSVTSATLCRVCVFLEVVKRFGAVVIPIPEVVTVPPPAGAAPPKATGN